ncbi:hypothetical protein J6590_071284 [Homalodisca vitripennis]|nr:hypothetical protein J6590_071284 [Homalodisca vitripennis]
MLQRDGSQYFVYFTLGTAFISLAVGKGRRQLAATWVFHLSSLQSRHLNDCVRYPSPSDQTSSSQQLLHYRFELGRNDPLLTSSYH